MENNNKIEEFISLINNYNMLDKEMEHIKKSLQKYMAELHSDELIKDPNSSDLYKIVKVGGFEKEGLKPFFMWFKNPKE